MTSLQKLLAIGLLQPRIQLQESLTALRELGPRAAANLVGLHKVRRIAKVRTKKALSGPLGETVSMEMAEALREFDAELDRTGRAREQRNVNLDGQLAEFRDRFPELPVRLMKGVAVRDWYQLSLSRDVGDADLWLPDSDDGWQLAGGLRDLGYVYQSTELPWLKRDLDGVLFGQIRMQHPDPGRIDVDIHIGPYSVRYCGLIRFTASRGQPAWSSLAAEDNLCAVIGNGAGDCFIDAKTINDVVVALSKPLDFDYVADTLSASELGGFLNAVLDLVEQSCQLNSRQLLALGRLRRDVPAENLTLSQTMDRDHRARLVTEHSYRMGERLTGDKEIATRIAQDAERAYSIEQPPRMRMSGGKPHRLPEMNPWTCVRLAPQEFIRSLCTSVHPAPLVPDRRTGLAEGLELFESEIGDLLRFREDVFLPTIDFLFCRKLVEADIVVGDSPS